MQSHSQESLTCLTTQQHWMTRDILLAALFKTRMGTTSSFIVLPEMLRSIINRFELWQTVVTNLMNLDSTYYFLKSMPSRFDECNKFFKFQVIWRRPWRSRVFSQLLMFLPKRTTHGGHLIHWPLPKIWPCSSLFTSDPSINVNPFKLQTNKILEETM